MRFRVLQSLCGGSKGNSSEDVDVAPKESQLLILTFHKSSLGVHHTQLQVAPWRRENPLLSLSLLYFPTLPHTHIPAFPLMPLWKARRCHWSCACAGVLQVPFGADRQQQLPHRPKDKWQKEKTFILRLQTQALLLTVAAQAAPRQEHRAKARMCQ